MVIKLSPQEALLIQGFIYEISRGEAARCSLSQFMSSLLKRSEGIDAPSATVTDYRFDAAAANVIIAPFGGIGSGRPNAAEGEPQR